MNQSPSQSWSGGVARILEMVSSRTGWEFPPTRWLYAETIIRQAMGKAKLNASLDFALMLERDRQALDALVEQLLIYETYFFRDRQHFDLIRDSWRREMDARWGDGHLLNLWSAGCASGEEPYSLAIVLKELGLAERSRILATDISRSALARAQQAIYNDWALRDSESQFIKSYFRQLPDGRFELIERIRKLVTFEYLNLSADSYPRVPGSRAAGRGFDLILCRNVTIYLARSLHSEVARHLYDALADGGWLILGPSDPLLDGYAPFELCELNGVLVHKRPPRTEFRTPTTREFATIAGPSPDATPESPPAPAPAPALASAPEPAPPSRSAASSSQEEIRQLAQRVRALADSNQLAEAERLVIEARTRHPVATEFIFHHMMILLVQHRYQEAAQLAGQLIFLDRTLVIAHFLQGTSLRAAGDEEGARRAFANAVRLCAERPAKEPVVFSEGESHARLGQAAAAQLALLKKGPWKTP